jgi:hypothetical protein
MLPSVPTNNPLIIIHTSSVRVMRGVKFDIILREVVLSVRVGMGSTGRGLGEKPGNAKV